MPLRARKRSRAACILLSWSSGSLGRLLFSFLKSEFSTRTLFSGSENPPLFRKRISINQAQKMKEKCNLLMQRYQSLETIIFRVTTPEFFDVQLLKLPCDGHDPRHFNCTNIAHKGTCSGNKFVIHYIIREHALLICPQYRGWVHLEKENVKSKCLRSQSSRLQATPKGKCWTKKSNIPACI